MMDEHVYNSYREKLVAGTKLPSIIRSNLAKEYLHSFERYVQNERVLAKMIEENNPAFVGHFIATSAFIGTRAPAIQFKEGYDELDELLKIIEDRVEFQQSSWYNHKMYLLGVSIKMDGDIYNVLHIPELIEKIVKNFQQTLERSGYKYISKVGLIDYHQTGKNWNFYMSGGYITREEQVTIWQSKKSML